MNSTVSACGIILEQALDRREAALGTRGGITPAPSFGLTWCMPLIFFPFRRVPLVDPWSSMKISPESFSLIITCLREISGSWSNFPKLDALPI